MNKIKKYFENHPDATIDDYNNQRHRMHVIQATDNCRTKHVGSKTKKQLLALMPRSISSFSKYPGEYTNHNGYIV